jgi:cytoskeletal protein CcmA (bactofilin family)
MSKKLFSVILAAFLVVTPFLVNGATSEAKDNYYLAPSLTINDNLYVAGADANVSGTVMGDLFVVGGNVSVFGPVEGDLMSAGGTLNISGKVTGDERLVGGNIMISNSVGGDLLVGGGQVNVLSNSIIGKDVEIAGGTVNYSGENNGNLGIAGRNVYINGKINGDVSVKAESVKLGPNAVITGNFDYSSLNEAVLEQGAKINGTVNFTKTTMPDNKKMADKGSFWGFISFVFTMKLIAITFVALIFVYLFKNQTKAIIEESVSNFWRKTGKGFILLVVIPFAIIISFITVIGTPLGVIAGLLYAVLLIISSILGNLLFAQLCMKYVFKKKEYELNWWIVILAVLVFGLISFIPFIGWLFKFIIFLAAFGSLADYALNKLKD